MRAAYNKVPLTIRLTPIQAAVLSSRRYGGSIAFIIRFLVDKLIDDELPLTLKEELFKLLEEKKVA